MHRILIGLLSMTLWILAHPLHAQGAPETTPAATLSPAELEAEAPSQISSAPDAASKVPTLSLYAESAYLNADGELVVDVLEQDYAYFSLSITDHQGLPMSGIAPEITIDGGSRIIKLEESNSGAVSNEYGQFDFAVIGGAMGMDTLSVRAAGQTTRARINVISLKAAGFASPEDIEGVLSWTELTQARVEYTDTGLTAEFPPAIADLNGKPVKLAGFMLPLEAQRRQTRFLLTSSPPSCFFHIPGGPAGAAEVVAPKGIEVSWDLIVLEGRLETLSSSEDGVVYRLLDAQQQK